MRVSVMTRIPLVSANAKKDAMGAAQMNRRNDPYALPRDALGYSRKLAASHFHLENLVTPLGKLAKNAPQKAASSISNGSSSLSNSLKDSLLSESHPWHNVLKLLLSCETGRVV